MYKTLTSCMDFKGVLANIDTTETTMLALQGGNSITRSPWAIWLKMLKDKATKLYAKQEKKSNSQHRIHSTVIKHVKGHSIRGGHHGRGGERGSGQGSGKESNRVPTKVTYGMQFTNKMTFISEEYAKLTDAHKTALYDVRKEARDKAPSRSISAAVTAPTPTPTPAPAAAPALVPVQRTVQAIGRVPTTPSTLPADPGNDICQILSQAATWSANQAQQVPATPTTTNDM
jgi:hypothetical protein